MISRLLTFFCVLGTASAAVVGTLKVTNCAGGGVTVTATSIDWTLPVGGGAGCIQADAFTNVVFVGGGNIAPTEIGTIKDLVFGVTPGNGFMTFSGAPGVGTLTFDLQTLGPGPSNACVAGMTNGQSCSAGGVGPIILTKTATGTAVSLTAAGVVNDGTSPTLWIGSYNTQFAGLSPFDIQSFIAGIPDANTGFGCSAPGGGVPGSCTSTYSGSFGINLTSLQPEPGSMLLIGTGLVCLAASVRKRKK